VLLKRKQSITNLGNAEAVDPEKYFAKLSAGAEIAAAADRP
jgi:hypothetical protein